MIASLNICTAKFPILLSSFSHFFAPHSFSIGFFLSLFEHFLFSMLCACGAYRFFVLLIFFLYCMWIPFGALLLLSFYLFSLGVDGTEKHTKFWFKTLLFSFFFLSFLIHTKREMSEPTLIFRRSVVLFFFLVVSIALSLCCYCCYGFRE